MAVSSMKRFEIFKRDGFKCQYCGRTPPAVILEVDHIVPVKSGGSSDEENLLTSCFDCNRGKVSRKLTTTAPDAVIVRATETRERVKQLKAMQNHQLKIEELQEQSVKRIINTWIDVFPPSRRQPLPPELSSKVRSFLKLESLSESEIKDAIYIVYGKAKYWVRDNFNYFCGVCWRKIRGPK